MEIATEAERVKLRKRIVELRKKILRLDEELKDLRRMGHARAQGVETRIANAGNTLACLYFEWVTGARLLDERVGPADEPVEMWSKNKAV